MTQQALILTSAGRYFDLAHPERSYFGIQEIAHALSQLCRFTGHTSEFYSVAQHCCHASYLVPPEHALAALLHDAAEAFLGDVSTPLKAMLPRYKELESGVEGVVFAKYGLPSKLHPCVKAADLQMLATEVRDLMPNLVETWDCLVGVQPMPERLIPWPSATAESLFLRRFEELVNDSEERSYQSMCAGLETAQ